MINRIHIENEATFNNEGVDIENLNAINIIYGANGSGKSTISRIVANISEYPDCTLEWKDELPLDILIYNKDFCDRNYSEHIPGVFTLGEASNDSLCQIEEKQRLLREIVDEGSKLRKILNEKETEIKNIKNSFKESVWSDLFKRHESRFSKSAIGAGTKDSFVKKVLDATKDKVEDKLELESLTDKAKVLFGIQPVRQTPIAKFNANELYSVESNELWTKIVVGKQDIDLAGLINSLGNSDWVSQGLVYIDKSKDICPFCQQHTITDEFKKKISSFFDAGYKNDLHQIGSLHDAYNQIAVIIINQLDSIVNAQKVLEKSSMDISALETVVSEFKLLLTSNQNLMATKSKEPSRVIALKSTKELISRINRIIDDSNLKILKHNQLIDNLSTERIILVKQIYKYFSIAYSAAIETYRKNVSDLEKAIEVLKSKIEIALSRHESVKNEINELERAITSITPTVNEINRLLQGFGFTNFMIREVPKEVNQYQIVRENGDIATSTLSEGERTFITFLYYMQLVKGSHTPDGVSRNRVLIIDDPVSSLDSNVLFVVSTLLRDIFASVYDGKSIVRQIILLTHNVYFHKEISFQDKGCKWRDRIHHWILRKRNNVSSIQAYYKTNPIRSSYELLWSELRNDSSISCLVSQNIMRRIVENYFQIFGGISPNDILNKFDNFEDKKICRSLLSWVNNGSHSMADDLFVEIADGQLERYKEIFKNIFCKMGQEAHYDMMMHLSNPENK